jgi:hypothetical protein
LYYIIIVSKSLLCETELNQNKLTAKEKANSVEQVNYSIVVAAYNTISIFRVDYL